MFIDTAAAAIFVTILLSLIGMGIAWGTLMEKVKNSCDDIEQNRTNIELNRQENKQDHTIMFDKLNEIRDMVHNLNGKTNHG